MLSKRVMVMGGNGCLGRAMIKSFQQKNWRTLSLDFSENKEANNNLILSKDLKI